MLDIHIIDSKKVAAIEWNGDPFDYDKQLSGLGKKFEKFIVVNPIMEGYLGLIDKSSNSEQCVVWKYQGDWIAKQFTNVWSPDVGYQEIEVTKPTFTWRKNPDLDRTMTFEDDPFGEYEPDPWDWQYELVWYIDPRFNPLEDKVWALSCKPIGSKVKGIKDMGYVIPNVNVEINSDLAHIEVDIDSLCPAFWDLADECAYELDTQHTDGEKMWVVKFSPAYRKPRDWKWYGVITPEFEVEYNPDLPLLDYELDYTIPWYDIGYDHVWILSRCHLQNNEDDIWAFKIITSRDSVGTKIIGEISPSCNFYVNENLPDYDYDINYVPPWYDFQYEHVWNLEESHLTDSSQQIWAVKAEYTKQPEGSKIIGHVSPRIKKTINPELKNFKFELDYDIPYYDLEYENVWYLDNKHSKEQDYEIWAVKCSALKNPSGAKKVGYLSPTISKIVNPELGAVNFKINYTIPYYDLEYEHVWMLDPRHSKEQDYEIWAVKWSAVSNPIGIKQMGYISPEARIKVNADLTDMPVPEDIVQQVQYYDFAYTNIWMLDKDFSANYDIWALQIDFLKDTFGTKEQGSLIPGSIIDYNPDLQYLNCSIEYKIPYHDREYQHVWYLDPAFSTGEKIWYAKMKAVANTTGEKDMGLVVPDIPKYLDVIFISFNEPNADKNYEKLKSIAPWAKRVDGVQGIFAAHKAAAKLSQTDMFYVVDGDADLLDNWKFNFQPNIFDRDCAYVWSSKNPINDLTYGYGGVKLFNKAILMNTKTWNSLDMFTKIMPKLKVQTRISNITAFNTDAFSTWRSAFRECVKLRYNLILNPTDQDSKNRLDVWTTVGEDRPYGKFSIEAAKAAIAFVESNSDSKVLSQINDYNWLKQEFENIYERRRTRQN